LAIRHTLLRQRTRYEQGKVEMTISLRYFE
jgi:hypothetical protein